MNFLYTLSSERTLLTKLGLNDPGELQHGKKASLGTIAPIPDLSVEVFVTAYPAKAWEFHITTPSSRILVTTGSGTLMEYWTKVVLLLTGETVASVAGCFDVEFLAARTPWPE